LDIRALAPSLGLLALLAAACAPGHARAATFQDDFAAGLSPLHWIVQKSADLPPYTVDASTGAVRVRKPLDPTHTGEQAVWIEFAHPVVGNFTAEIQYHGAAIARVSGGAGNDLSLRARFTGQDWSVRRASEGGTPAESYYAWADPPGFAYGRTATNVNAGTLRIVRQSILLSFIADDATLSTAIVTSDTLQSIAFGLENHGTTDSTAVTFDDFALTADQILTGIGMAGVDGGAPGAFALDVAPNPVRARATLALALPRAAAVRVRVLDLQGRVVARLHDGLLSAGRHAFTWEVVAGVPPGLYLAVAETPGHSVRARVAVVR
jgi:hypothetical protein